MIHEPVATEQYERTMFAPRTPLKVLKSGFVVCSDMLLLGGSPDDKAVDFGCHYCFAPEVKYPVTKYQGTPVEACHEPNFSHEAVHGQCKQKRNHGEHTQVQGQMDASGALRCDFIVYT